MPPIQIHTVDLLLMVAYFMFVLGIGFYLRRQMKTGSDFLLAGKSVPAWVAGLAFLSANLGAQEVMGMAASGAKYGIMTSHFYWVGAIPAMAFVAIFMMPFYYGSKARSVPEFLKLRFDYRTHIFNACSFTAMTVFSSGISMYALSKLFEVLMGWNFHASVAISAVIVLAYIYLGGLTSAIYNEVLQFFLIVAGFLPLVFLGLRNIGGWSGLCSKLNAVATSQGYQEGTWTSAWAHLGSAQDNPMGVEWFGLVMGLGFVLSFGYWCTDFLVVQRAMAADSMLSARRTPLIAAIPKMLFPALVILPGMVAIALASNNQLILPKEASGEYNYNMVVPALLSHYFPPGMLGLGLTALMASFMSGMAGNVTAFNTVVVYDLYQNYLQKGKSEKHYLRAGHYATIAGISLSVLTAYATTQFNNIMDMLQLVFAFINAPLFATFMLGMFWRRCTAIGALWGLVSGTCAAGLHHGLTLPAGATSGIKGGWFHFLVYTYPSEMAQNFWTAIYAWSACFFMTIGVSLATRRTKSDQELEGLVYSLTPKIKNPDLPWIKRPSSLAIAVLLGALILNLIFY